jgi:hypothetical protein
MVTLGRWFALAVMLGITLFGAVLIRRPGTPYAFLSQFPGETMRYPHWFIRRFGYCLIGFAVVCIVLIIATGHLV